MKNDQARNNAAVCLPAFNVTPKENEETLHCNPAFNLSGDFDLC